MSMLQIQPDPKAPMGGVGLLRLPATALVDDHTHVQVQNAYMQLWLAPNSGEDTLVEVGDGNWQADPHKFGPYGVTRQGAYAVVRIGPEIVNKLMVFTPVVLRVGGRDYDVIWPDDVPPRAGAALMGALKATMAIGPNTDAARLVGRKTKTEDSDPETKAPPFGEAPAVDGIQIDGTASSGDPGTKEPDANRRLLVIGVLVLAAIAAVFSAFFIFRAPGNAAPEPLFAGEPESMPAPPTSILQSECSFDALAAMSGGFQARAEALRGACGAVLGSEGAFRLIEQSARAGDAQAWLALAILYDPNFTDPLLEGALGIAPGDNLPLAAEYYDNARVAGAIEAAERLARVCESLADRSDTLSRGARNDFCR